MCWYLEEEICACSCHDVQGHFLQHLGWLLCVVARCKQQQWQGQQRHGEKLITSQDHNLWLKELPCWPHGFQIVMLSKQIIIIFMNTNLKGILEWRASKKDNMKTEKFQIPMLFLKRVDLLLKNIPSGWLLWSWFQWPSRWCLSHLVYLTWSWTKER
jgi:hypothetical protein